MFLTIVIFFVVLGILVFVHELGHFYTARKLGIGVEEFGFGFPPRMFGIEKKGIIYSINWIPIGGFVKIKGQDGESGGDSDSFVNAPVWKRMCVLFAGVFMNWALAFVLISVGYFIGIPSMIDSSTSSANIRDSKIQIIEVYKGSGAYDAGIQMGDVVKSVDNKTFDNIDSLQSYLKSKESKDFDFVVTRESGDINLKVNSREIPESDGKKVVGIGMVNSGTVSYPWYRATIEGAKTTAIVSYRIGEAFFGLIGDLFHGKGSDEVSGPIGVAVFTGKAVSMGFIYVLQFMALLSINLAIINILPFPALDGGRILFLVIEKIRRKKNNQEIEGIVHSIGFYLLMALIVFVTYKDVLRYGGQVIGAMKNIF